MTLIACNINHKVPFLISDILMSSKREPDIVMLPTNNFDIRAYLDPLNPFKIDSLAQKLYVIEQKICVAFSGREDEIIPFLQELKLRCRIMGEMSKSNMQLFLDEYDLEQNFPRSSFFMLLIEHVDQNDIQVNLFRWPIAVWKGLNSDVMGEVYATGSGRDEFLNIIRQLGHFESRIPKGEILYAIQTHLALIAKLLAIEKTTLYTLKDNWGGGFETAFYNGRTFEKLEKVAFVVMKGQFDTDGQIGWPKPALVIYCEYLEGLLRIHAFEVEETSVRFIGDKIVMSAPQQKLRVEYYDVPTLDEMAENTPSKDLSFRTAEMAIGYSIATTTGGVFTPSYFNSHPELTVSFTPNEGLEIALNITICQNIAQKAKAIFDKGVL